ncbi:MAG: hypothetical protein C4582_12230 [Desulfobacteraceae bacterium]|jgi:hypothetical protein|nr:MAG: hypothetical protein C4582_12230 [Desulfobacteraceae bacterium]
MAILIDETKSYGNMFILIPFKGHPKKCGQILQVPYALAGCFVQFYHLTLLPKQVKRWRCD